VGKWTVNQQKWCFDYLIEKCDYLIYKQKTPTTAKTTTATKNKTNKQTKKTPVSYILFQV